MAVALQNTTVTKGAPSSINTTGYTKGSFLKDTPMAHLDSLRTTLRDEPMPQNPSE